ncbi:hypothetical protein EC973_003543 [Apophysomyces ossiformis]|uniref:Uncharacterized protein n=1 Tax=Apophysomyces ossiformis TaxID=679940 RepID=A0A8H7EM01_9FUNG|nr:hypothetical protein EC973_003543 [Apophysomyces ossiformis]
MFGTVLMLSKPNQHKKTPVNYQRVPQTMKKSQIRQPLAEPSNEQNERAPKTEQDNDQSPLPPPPLPPKPEIQVEVDDKATNKKSDGNTNSSDTYPNDPTPRLLATDTATNLYQRRRRSQQYLQKILRLRRHSIADGVAPSIISSTISVPPAPCRTPESPDQQKKLRREDSRLAMKGKDLKRKVKRALSFRNQ